VVVHQLIDPRVHALGHCAVRRQEAGVRSTTDHCEGGQKAAEQVRRGHHLEADGGVIVGSTWSPANSSPAAVSWKTTWPRVCPGPVVGYLPLMSARRDCSAMLLLQTPREFARTVRAQQRQWDVIGT